MRQLAQSVGVQSGSIFHHFGSKEEILVAVMQKAMHDALARQAEVAKTLDGNKDQVRAGIRAHLDSLLSDGTRELMSVFLFDWRSLSEDARARVVDLRDEYENRFKIILASAAKDGLVPHDPHFRFYLLGALNWTLWWYRPDGGTSVEELAEIFLKFACGGDAGTSNEVGQSGNTS